MSFDDSEPYRNTKDWPTKEIPDTRYKLGSLLIVLSQDYTTIERQTYNVLEWLGDVGGLFDGFVLIARYLIAPIATYAIKTELLSAAFAAKNL